MPPGVPDARYELKCWAGAAQARALVRGLGLLERDSRSNALGTVLEQPPGAGSGLGEVLA